MLLKGGRERGSHLCCRPDINPPFFTSDSVWTNRVWRDGWFSLYAGCFDFKKFSFLSVHSLGCRCNQSIAQYNSTKLIRSWVCVCCTVNYQYFFFTNSCSWKANWEHAQNLFNNLENKLLCVTTGKIVGEITSGWLFPHRQGASAGDLN